MAGAPSPVPFVLLPRSSGPVLAYAAVLIAAFAAFRLLAGTPLVAYHIAMSALLLPLVAWRQPAVASLLARLPVSPGLRFLLLAYAAVLAEETLVGTIAALWAEGDPGVWPTRLGQFIALNLIVFTGPILALALHARLTAPHPWELLVIAGGWGLFAEAILQRLAAAPLLAGLLVWPTAMVYALIFLPATLASPRGTRRPPLPLRALLTWTLAFAISVPLVLAADHLRRLSPGLFPPCHYTGC